LLLRLVTLLLLIVLGPSALADGGVALPAEVSWVKIAADVISTVGMPGVVAFLIYVVKVQRDELIEERAFTRILQDARATAAAKSTELAATVAAASSAAIAANTGVTVDMANRLQRILDVVQNVPGEHARILAQVDRNYERTGEVLSRAIGGKP